MTSLIRRGALGVGWALTVLLAVRAGMRTVWRDGAWALLVANSFTPYLYRPAAGWITSICRGA